MKFLGADGEQRGLTGAADTVLVIRRDDNGGQSHRATVYGRGRDIAEVETAIEFSDTDFRLKVLGDAWKVADTAEQQQILEILQDAGEPIKLADIVDALGKSASNVSNMLGGMKDAGLLTKPATGFWTLVNPVNRVNVEDEDSPDSPDSLPPCNDVGCIGESLGQSAVRRAARR